jgi:hypothetical protein
MANLLNLAAILVHQLPVLGDEVVKLCAVDLLENDVIDC